MKFYTKQHQFYCGIDLHADAMRVCVLDSCGEIVVHRNIPTKPKSFLRLIKPYRDRLVVGCGCMFTWYWPADLCNVISAGFCSFPKPGTNCGHRKLVDHVILNGTV